jgi:hypothetical protein
VYNTSQFFAPNPPKTVVQFNIGLRRAVKKSSPKMNALGAGNVPDL